MAEDSKESFPSTSRPIFPLFPAVEKASSDKQEAGSTSWLSNVSFQPRLAEDVQQAFDSASITGERHDKGLGFVPKKRHTEQSDKHAGTSDHEEHLHKKKKRKKDRKHGPKQHSPSPPPSGKHMWLEEVGLKPEAAYQFDKKRDPDNLLYLALDRSHIAKYKRICHECIGQTSSLELKWDDGRGFKTSKRGKKDSAITRYFQKRAPEEHVTEQISTKPEESFLPSSSAEKAVKCSGTEKADFLTLEASTPDAEAEEEAGLLTAERQIAEQTGRYNRLLLEDPHNVNLWIEFIAFQEKAGLWGNTPISSLTMGEVPQDTIGKTEKRRQQMALMERKIAIYEKALEKNPINVELLTGHMLLSQEIWERERVIRRWKDLVFRQPQSAKLWLGYLQYCQAHYSSFSTSSLIATYTKALSTLCSILEGTMVSHKPEDDTEEAMLAIFMNLCAFLQQSGHTEKAVACFQALVEFNFFPPDSLSHTDVKHKQKVEFFETFWDSGAPRFGEADAVGWKNWFQSETIIQGQPTRKLGFFEELSLLVPHWQEEEESDVGEETEREFTMLKGRTLHDGWVELERFREKEHFLPWHTEEGPPGVEPEEPEDPDRIVLFEDVASVLFSLTKENTRVSLLAMFLHFLGAPTPPTLVAAMFPQCLSTQLHNHTQLLLPQIFAQDLFSYNAVMFASELYYHSFCVGSSIQPLSEEGKFPQKSVQFIHSVFNQVLPLLPQSYTSLFGSIWLLLEYSQVLPDVVSFWNSDQKKMPKQLKQAVKLCDKFAKSLLQRDALRDSIPIWCTYAILKAVCGDRESAMKVVEVVTLQVGQGGTSADSPEALLACKTYLEIVLGAVSPTDLCKDSGLTISRKSTKPPTQEEVLKAKHCLICLAEGQFEPFSPDKVTSTLLLKGERKLQERCQRQLLELKASATAAEPQLNSFTLLASCLAWLVYLNAGLDAACSFLSQIEDSLVDDTDLQHTRNADPLDRHIPTAATKKVNQWKLGVSAPLQAVLQSVVALRVRLIHFSALHHPDPPSRLRLALSAGVSTFPENVCFLWQFATHETQSFLVRRVRRHFDSHVQQAQTGVPWLVAIAFEERRKKILQSHTPSPGGIGGVELEELQTGVVNRMRALYQRATQHPSGRNCPLLWRAYMKFELLCGSEKASEAVFYQAVQQCPWAKVLYMDAAQCLTHLGGDKVVEMMEEKEIRLRAPLEEVQLLKDAAKAAENSKPEAQTEDTSPQRQTEGPRANT